MRKSIQDFIDDKFMNTDVEALNLDFRDLTSLKGIEKLKNLKKLSISSNFLKSLNGIEKCKTLETLFCYNNYLKNLTGVEKLVNLKYLYCQNNYKSENQNAIESIECLENLENLETLCISQNKLKSIKGVENLKKLSRLDISDNPCALKYSEFKDTDVVGMQEKFKLELHLKVGDNLRGAASISDTGLFDFKTK